MSSPRKIIAVLIFAIVAICPASATYAGDKPLVTAFEGAMNGGYVFSIGNSTYSGTLNRGDQYTVSFTTDIPPDAVLRYQRYYVYWAWSRQDQRPVFPSISATCSASPGSEVRPAARYVDNKGFASPSDFFSGMDTFSGGDILPGKTKVICTVENTGDQNSTFVIQGIGLLAVYECSRSHPGITIVKEGCDMLYNSYGITPEMATSRVDFDPEIDTGRVEQAVLRLVAPSGGYTRSDIIQKNTACFNRENRDAFSGFFMTVLNLLFPEAKGKTWIDIFDSDQQQQIGIEIRDVTPYLVSRSNYAAVQDRGDYLLLTNAILRVDYREP